MTASEIRELSPEERLRKLDDLRQELFNLCFQKEVGQLENPKKLKQIKADIARVHTVVRQTELQETTDKE